MLLLLLPSPVIDKRRIGQHVFIFHLRKKRKAGACVPA
jgi:hypothetical protein